MAQPPILYVINIELNYKNIESSIVVKNFFFFLIILIKIQNL